MVIVHYIFHLFNVFRRVPKQLIILFASVTLFASGSLAQQITVQSGDTLIKLAAQHNTKVEDIVSINNLEDLRLRIGDRLYMSPPYEEVRVNRGDTLTTISARYGVTVQALLETNNLTSTHITAGDALRIPLKEEVLENEDKAKQENVKQSTVSQSVDVKSEVLAEAEQTTNVLEERLTKRLQSGREYVIVQPGDTLTRITKDFSISIQDIMAFNNLSSTRLDVGDVIYVSAPPPPPEELHTITVKIGDTLSDLAARYDTTPQALMRANTLATPFIRTGQVLVLPNDALTTPLVDVASAETQFYTVQSGDALYKIALRFGIPQERLIALNNLEGTTIYAGQELKLAGQGEELKPLLVTVDRGDTLAIIAREYDVSVREVVSANNLNPENILHVGQELIIPERYVTNQSNLQLDQGASEVRYINVGRGDTLWELAKHHSTSVESIVADNRLSSYHIKEGQTLRITPDSDLPPVARPKFGPQTSSPDSSTSLSFEDSNLDLSDLGSDLEERTSKLIWPLDGPITSRFGYRHLVISGRSYNIHTGLDIDGETGDPILAAGSGKVIFSGWRSGYGYLVVIESLPYHYYYAHASKLTVSEGDNVSQGDIIAKVGATGAATGSHLHFEIRVDDKPQNPLDYLE